MRTNLMLLASAVLLAACSNDAETTAPRNAPVAATSNVSAAAPAPAPSAKPTKGPTVTQEVSILVSIDGVTSISEVTWAICPVGTVFLGGGYRIESGVADLRLRQSAPFADGSPGFVVEGFVPAGKTASFRAVALCLTP